MNDNRKIKYLFQLIFLIGALPLTAQIDTLHYGDNLANRLESGEIDSYTFEGRREDRIILRLTGSGMSFDGRLELLNPDGSQVLSLTSRSGEVGRMITNLNKTGFYTIRLLEFENEDQGAYGISLQKVNPAENATVLSNADERNDQISQPAEMHAYTFCGMPGDRIEVLFTDRTASLKSQIELFAPQGELIVRRNGQPGAGINLDTTLTDSGLFTLLISDASGKASGDYTLFFRSSGNCTVTPIRQNLCPGQVFIFNGSLYDEFKPFGVEQVEDTLFIIQLRFPPPSVGKLDRTLCNNDFIIVNGNRYDTTRPSGREVLRRQSATGCDSIVNINLRFADTLTGDLRQTLCEGESLTVNGTVYDQDNPSGTELLPGGSAGGCDSLINIQLDFTSGGSQTIAPTLCPGEAITVNGTVYDQFNPSGTEIIELGSCDSVVMVQLDFFPEPTRFLTSTICPDEFITVNGTVYDLNNASGTERLAGAAANGCDSIVEIQLFFYQTFEKIEETLCPDEFITVNGVIYDRRNPSGIERLPGDGAGGCDSIIQVQLDFYTEASSTLTQTLCPGDSILINGTVYDQDNPIGTEFLFGQAANGCDSILDIQLSFYPEVVETLQEQICPGESILVNGTLYDESRLSGTEIIEGGGANGCDSIVVVDLTIDSNCALNSDFYIPSGITPNGDGQNDHFRIPALTRTPQYFENNELIIQNRWGQVVFQASPYQNDWAGTNPNGAPLPAGTYFYSFRYGPEKQGLKQGEVTIIR